MPEIMGQALVLPSANDARRDLALVAEFQQLVKSTLQKDLDYGVIEGTKSPTLLKAGAEKITKLLGLCDLYTILDRQEDWKTGFFRYLIKCQLVKVDGTVVTEGMGECNSLESKYRWRWVYEREVPAGMDINQLYKKEHEAKNGGRFFTYRIPNDDIYTQVNTLLKMAEKRALVDAALHAGRLSDIFTQDIEDIPELAERVSKPVPPRPASQQSATKPQVQTASDAPESKSEPPKETGKGMQPVKEQGAQPAGPEPAGGEKRAPQRSEFQDLVNKISKSAQLMGYRSADLKGLVKAKFGKDSSAELTKAELESLLVAVESGETVAPDGKVKKSPTPEQKLKPENLPWDDKDKAAG